MKGRFALYRVFLGAVAGSIILLSGFLAGCASGTSPGEINVRKATDLKNVILNMRDLAGKPARLKNGRFRGDHLVVRVLYDAAGDLNGDGLVDGVIIISRDLGGSGSFRDLCLLMNNGNRLVHTDQALIGDRVRVTSLGTDGNIVMVDYLDRGADDAYSTRPYIKKRVRYRVREGKLEQLPGA